VPVYNTVSSWEKRMPRARPFLYTKARKLNADLEGD